MIDYHYWTTPNGHKIAIFLEESGLQYRISQVNLSENKQFSEGFLRITPNNKIPAIVDHAPEDGGAPIAIFESGAILIYLGDKVGKFVPKDVRGRVEVMQWLFWQVGAECAPSFRGSPNVAADIPPTVTSGSVGKTFSEWHA